MTPAQFQKLFEQKLNEIKRYAREDLPRHIGKISVDHFHENFQRGGYVDDKLQPWKQPKRFGADKSAGSAYGPLLSSRKLLYNSIRFTASERRVVISSSLKYSKIHNEGGQISVTSKMRKFAWAKYYESNKTAEGWMAMALKQTIIIPKRQYMGRSIALNRLIQARMKKDITKILKTA